MTNKHIEQPPALEISQLSVNYDRTPVLWDISCSIPQGNMVAIVGPNGAGKSSLVKSILKLIPTISGKIRILDQPYEKIKSQISYVPQRETVDWDFPITVSELINMGAYGKNGLFSFFTDQNKKDAKYYMELFQLEHLADRQISELSGGQQQRTFLARAMMQNAQVYFLDEPFAGIDLNSENIIVDQLKKLRDAGKTIFIVHHALSTVTNYFDWVIILNLRLVSSGPIESAFNEPCLCQAYGRTHAMFKEVISLSEKKETGAA